MNKSGFPHAIKSGYPEKFFEFTGEFETVSTNARAAARNRKYLLAPIFRSQDGEVIVAMQYAKKCKKTSTPSEVEVLRLSVVEASNID